MPEIIGSTNRILEVNLTTGKTAEFQVTPEDRRRYLGGKGLALKYLYDRLRPGCDPLGEDNVLAIMAGLLVGTGAPCSSRFALAGKSPLTGILAASSCGGPFGLALKATGYEGLLVTGRAPGPVCLVIEETGVRLEPAEALWGLGTQAAQDALRLNESAGALAIGPAGENQVRYASVASRRRFFGRGGLGAVMGAKNLKAIVAAGSAYKQVPHDPRAFMKATAAARAQIDFNSFTARMYRTYGTDVHVNLCNRTGILPVRNFRDGSSPEAVAVAGETLAQRYRSKPSVCQTCTILCGHKGTYPDGTVRQLPEYETTALFGPNLGVFDPDVISEWNELCCDLGMDTMSTAGTLAYVMEAGEKGLLKTSLRFGSPEGVSETLREIACRRGAGDELANGSRWLAGKYGGMAFAIQVKGLEMAAYDPRGAWGQGLAFAVANRGADHLSAPIFPLETFFGYLPPDTTRSKVQFTLFFENFAAALNALGVCLFTAFAYLFEAPVVKATPKPLLSLVMRALPDVAVQLMDFRAYTDQLTTSSGLKLSQRELLRVGERIHVLERWMNTREGITRRDDTLPARFLTEGRTCDPCGATVPQDRLLAGYYRTRGYDANGVPTAARLDQLGIPTGPQRQSVRSTTRGGKQNVSSQ